MKEKGNKHDLVKIAGLMILLTVILTWIIPQGYFSGSGVTVGDITRIGIFDFFTYGLLGMYYFTVLVTCLFVIGGFYQVLSKVKGYQKLTDWFAKKFDGKEIFFTVLVSFIIAALTAITTEYFIIIAVIPFIITIMKKMGLKKITGFVTTFGSIIVGLLGSVYNGKVAGMNIQLLGAEYNTYIWLKVIIFAIAFILFTLFNILYILKNKESNKIVDMFEDGEVVSKKEKVWPLVVVLTLGTVITILAYLPWTDAFNITWFSDALTKILECEIFGSTVFAFIFGNVQAFGAWDIFGVQIVMLVSTLIIKWIYKIKISDIFESFGEGFKKMGKLVVILLLTYVVLEFAVMYPVLPTMVDWILGLTDKFNAFTSTLSGLLTSVFGVEYQYVLNLVGQFLNTKYSAYSNELPIMLQSTFGLASMFTPASSILLMGLAYLGISYKEWMKYIWKFLVLMLIAIIVIMLIIC